jgi:hypothetical protein
MKLLADNFRLRLGDFDPHLLTFFDSIDFLPFIRAAEEMRSTSSAQPDESPSAAFGGGQQIPQVQIPPIYRQESSSVQKRSVGKHVGGRYVDLGQFSDDE